MRGHIRQRSKGSWTCVVELDRDPVTGQRRQFTKTIRGRKRDADLLLAQLISQREMGIDVPSGKATVGQYLQRWLSDYAQVNVGPRTYERYEQLCRVHLVPALGSIALTKLRPLQIQGAYRQLLEKGLSAQTVLHCHRVLRGALGRAVKWQLLARNPTDPVEAPRPERREMRALMPAEIQTLLDAAASTDLYHVVFVALGTGLRLGELMALRWRAVDLEHGMVQVVRSLQYVAGKGLTFTQTKTHRSHRGVSLSRETVAVLGDLRRKQVEGRLALGPAYQDNDLVFADPAGAPMPPYKVSHRFHDLAMRAGLTPLRFHDLRHSHATLLLRAGAHVKLVSQRLGHAGVAITLDTYSHVQPDIQAETANLIDSFLVTAAK